MLEKIILAKPRGFCAGVERAIEVVEMALSIFSAPIYVRKEIVHNPHVVRALREKGAVFVEELDDVPEGQTVVFSAHGISPAVRELARARHLRVIDATCPLVTKVHLEAIRYAKEGYCIILIGHAGHEEVVGTTGEAADNIQIVQNLDEANSITPQNPEKIAVITQTTLSLDDTKIILDALRRRFPNLTTPSKDDICYATQNRQNAVKAIAQEAQVILVIGAKNSSNSIRLREVAKQASKKAYLINDITEIDPAWFKGAKCVGVSSGASAPEHLVQQTVEFLKTLGAKEVIELSMAEEDINFGLPQELLKVSK
jgi:4-hydroxy-3-methylbut-2-en-1-yl diphosphate reductase